MHGYYINDLFRASRKFKVPFIILANSWDNCCTNAFSSGIPDKLIVWGEQAKVHAKKYLNVPNEKIECFGAAQFEIYKKLQREDRKQLADFFEVDPQKKLFYMLELELLKVKQYT